MANTLCIKAITLWQPWASLIARHAKLYETRSWSTRYRGWLAIHAAKRKPEGFTAAAHVLAEVGYTRWSQLPTGAIVAVARLTGVISTDARAFVENLSEQERTFGDYSPGRYAWKLEDVRRLEEPIAVAGKQGLWNWELTPDLWAMLEL
jgi:activating signal cointegrator 1